MNDPELEQKLKILMNKINKRIKKRNELYKNETNPEIINFYETQNIRIKNELLKVINRLKDLQDGIINNRIISKVEINTLNGKGNIKDTESLIDWWHKEEKNFLLGKYKITFSKYGIEKIERISNEGSIVLLEEENIINGIETFNNTECVLCLDENKKPNILFCNCGHVCLCSDCNKIYRDNKCPICKIENSIKRKINK